MGHKQIGYDVSRAVIAVQSLYFITKHTGLKQIGYLVNLAVYFVSLAVLAVRALYEQNTFRF